MAAREAAKKRKAQQAVLGLGVRVRKVQEEVNIQVRVRVRFMVTVGDMLWVRVRISGPTCNPILT